MFGSTVHALLSLFVGLVVVSAQSHWMGSVGKNTNTINDNVRSDSNKENMRAKSQSYVEECISGTEGKDACSIVSEYKPVRPTKLKNLSRSG